MCGVRVKLHTVCIMESADMSCKFNDGYLHTKAETKVWNVVFSCVFCCGDHTLDTAGTKSSRNNDTCHIAEQFFCIVII